MPRQRLRPFEATLVRPAGVGNWTYLTVPFSALEVFGERGRVAIRGRIDGHPFRGSLMPHGNGRHFVVVNKTLRTAIGKEAGDLVCVELDRDDEPRTLPLPAALETALGDHEEARKAFDRLSYSHRREYVDWIEGAKRPETKEHRAKKAVEMLMVGKGVKSELPRK
jgi:hypothetical protein